MRILDIYDNVIIDPDMSAGRMRPEKLFIKHHPATEFVQEIAHYETIRQYKNGGRDVRKVVDVPGIEAKDAWDEYEDILRFIPYTEEEIADMRAEDEALLNREDVIRMKNELSDNKEIIDALLSMMCNLFPGKVDDFTKISSCKKAMERIGIIDF